MARNSAAASYSLQPRAERDGPSGATRTAAIPCYAATSINGRLSVPPGPPRKRTPLDSADPLWKYPPSAPIGGRATPIGKPQPPLPAETPTPTTAPRKLPSSGLPNPRRVCFRFSKAHTPRALPITWPIETPMMARPRPAYSSLELDSAHVGERHCDCGARLDRTGVAPSPIRSRNAGARTRSLGANVLPLCRRTIENHV